MSTRFTKLEVKEIREKAHVDDEQLIVQVLKEMIKKEEIFGEFFSSLKAIAFDQQANLTQIDDLLEKYKEWEKENKKK